MSEELSFPSSDVSSPPSRPTVQIDSALRPYVYKKHFYAKQQFYGTMEMDDLKLW